MGLGNDFEDMRRLPREVLDEIVREGEARLQAQLATATAADQRALTFAGFQITSATAALAGGVVLIVGDKIDPLLAAVAIFFACGLLSGAWLALQTVKPDLFDLPGNSPHNWAPRNWVGYRKSKLDITQARLEQASCLDKMIEDNALCAKLAAEKIHLSMRLTVWSVLSGAMLLGTVVIDRAISAESRLYIAKQVNPCTYVRQAQVAEALRNFCGEEQPPLPKSPSH